MKTTLNARIAAKPVKFPDDIEMIYHALDEQNNPTGETYRGVHFPWDEVQRRFAIDADYAKECESYFHAGSTAYLGNRTVIIEPEETHLESK